MTESPDIGVASLLHGGDLTAARRRFPDAPEPFIDLSTGINPHSYPLPQLSPELFARLPEPAALERLAAIAGRSLRRVDRADQVAAAPGTQILLPSGLCTGARRTRGGAGTDLCGACARRRGSSGTGRQEVTAIDDLGSADLAVVVNPNNPDGRIVSKDALLALADEKRRRGGLLVVDEAFGMSARPA